MEINSRSGKCKASETTNKNLKLTYKSYFSISCTPDRFMQKLATYTQKNTV